MSNTVIFTTSHDIPDWVVQQARELGIRFVPLERSPTANTLESNLTPSSQLSAENIATQLERIRPDGYLLNGPPDYGPYFDGNLADSAPGLRLVTYFGQSLEPAEYNTFLDIPAMASRGIAVTTTPGATESVAEGAIGLLTALDLDLVPHHIARSRGAEGSVKTRKGLYGSTLGIVGMGQIGRRVARLARALGMVILYTSRSRKRDAEQSLDAGYRDLADLFTESDYVSIHTPGSVTEGLIDAQILAHARGIGLINTTSIPRIVDALALLTALERGWVRKVAIEGVYPDPYDERLRAFGDDRVLLLPAYTSWDTEHSWRKGWERYLETLAALASDAPIPHRLRAR